MSVLSEVGIEYNWVDRGTVPLGPGVGPPYGQTMLISPEKEHTPSFLCPRS